MSIGQLVLAGISISSSKIVLFISVIVVWISLFVLLVRFESFDPSLHHLGSDVETVQDRGSVVCVVVVMVMMVVMVMGVARLRGCVVVRWCGGVVCLRFLLYPSSCRSNRNDVTNASVEQRSHLSRVPTMRHPEPGARSSSFRHPRSRTGGHHAAQSLCHVLELFQVSRALGVRVSHRCVQQLVIGTWAAFEPPPTSGRCYGSARSIWTFDFLQHRTGAVRDVAASVSRPRGSSSPSQRRTRTRLHPPGSVR